MGFDAIKTCSPQMESILRSAQLISRTEVTVLVVGESGTGKELIARAIHQNSPRGNHPFIAVNCASLPENLAESLLFGHRKGAFTGADGCRAGLIEAAEKGTLFLDEIGELPLVLQAKFLRFLESGEVLPLGEHLARKVPARVLAATHRDLYAMVKQGQFRQDLYYRLSIVPIEIPPLRERKEDIDYLLDYFFKHFSSQHQLAEARLTANARKQLKGYGWPGNVRELRNLCERLTILSADHEVDAHKLPLETQGNDKAGTPLQAFCLPPEGIRLDELERHFLYQALERTRHNKSQAARLLGISRDALNYRLKKYLLGS